MKRIFVLSASLLFAISGCAGAEEEAEAPAETQAAEPAAEAPAEQAAPSMPSWFRMDGNAVEIDIVAGATADLNYWNFNGATQGNMTITVPEGAEVTVNFRNDDPNMAHSLGIGPLAGSPPASPAPEPVFEGAISGNPTSMTESTLTGESESVTFTADQAGEYAMLCYIPGHAVSGMWVRFVVGGEPGVTGAPDVEIAM